MWGYVIDSHLFFSTVNLEKILHSYRNFFTIWDTHKRKARRIFTYVCARLFWRWKHVEMKFFVPDRSALVPTQPLYKGKWLSFPGFNRPLRGVIHPPSPSAEIKVNVEP